MIEAVDKHRALLETIADPAVDQRIKRAIYLYASESLTCTLCACALNILLGNIPLDGDEIAKLKSVREFVHTLADQNQKESSKRRLIGGSLGCKVIPAIVRVALRAVDNVDYTSVCSS